MHKFIATLILLSSLLFAKSLKEYQIFADKVEAQGDYIYALGDVVVYSKDYVLNANRIVFNKKTQEVELFGNVHILGFDDKAIDSEYMRVNLKTKKLSASPFFFFDPKTYVWIKSFEAETETDRYNIDHAIVSSCDVKKPDWKITFEKGYYDKNSSMVTIKNAVFYGGKVPLFYLPYFKFPTDKSRHSGLLRPSGGYEKVEGLYYRQPFYIVLDESKDIEIDPQVRTRRGKGLYATLRFADSLYSRGFLRVGAFWEKYGYYDKYDLKNKSHRGFEIGYERSKLFSGYFDKGDTEDGLLVDITYLNDIDYLNLQESNKKKIFNKLVTSKINYFLDRGKDFVGIYAKYFIDTEKVSNKDTLQTLPSVQYHRVIQPILFNNLLYSSDFKFKNWYRKEGVSAKQYELSLPIILYFSFFGDYLNFSASENLYLTYVDYDNSDLPIANGSYFSNYHKFSLNSDLLKRYETFIHNLNIDLDFIVPSVENKSGDFEDFITLNKEKKSLNLSLSQFFYDEKAFNFFLHRIRQSYYFDDDIYKYGDLENEFRYRFSKYFEIYNQLFYSYEKHRLRKSQTTVTYNKEGFDMKLIHNYEKAVKKENDSDFFIAKFKTKISSRYDLFANIDYDMENHFTREWKIGWIFKKKCWNYKIAYRQSVTPSLTSEGTESITKKGVFLILNLVPIGGIHYEFTKSSNFSEDR